MEIISHRGYWLEPSEKNSEKAFQRSFGLGFGTETDIRDYCGKLVISHDVPNGDEMSVESMLKIYQDHHCEGVLALNIKSDGLQQPLKILLEQFSIRNYFLFDMSVPDAIVSVRSGLTCFTRQSEYERDPSFYDLAEGVWLDEFYQDWITSDEILKHKNNKKKVCIVSPELHKRDPVNKWEQYKKASQKNNFSEIILCTDLPEKAQGFINGKN